MKPFPILFPRRMIDFTYFEFKNSSFLLLAIYSAVGKCGLSVLVFYFRQANLAQRVVSFSDKWQFSQDLEQGCPTRTFNQNT